MTWQQMLAVLGGYLFGSVDFAVWVTKSQGFDIYQMGSGNPGTANVARNLGWKWAGLVLVGDLAKGALAALLGLLAGDVATGFAAGLAAVLGHCFPVWHRFKGGKGVATAGGVVLALAPWVALGLAGLWAVMAKILRISSVASLTVTLLAVPALALTGHSGWALVWAGSMMLLILIRHRSNITRLARGEEQLITRTSEEAGG